MSEENKTSQDVRQCGEVTICRNGYVEELESKLIEALKDAEKARAYKRVMKNENARLRVLAGELIAAVRVNYLRGTFGASEADFNAWIDQWTKRLQGE